jgi:hypothetical protein
VETHHVSANKTVGLVTAVGMAAFIAAMIALSGMQGIGDNWGQ